MLIVNFVINLWEQSGSFSREYRRIESSFGEFKSMLDDYTELLKNWHFKDPSLEKNLGEAVNYLSQAESSLKSLKSLQVNNTSMNKAGKEDIINVRKYVIQLVDCMNNIALIYHNKLEEATLDYHMQLKKLKNLYSDGNMGKEGFMAYYTGLMSEIVSLKSIASQAGFQNKGLENLILAQSLAQGQSLR